jgi:dienelactone hydrolase
MREPCVDRKQMLVSVGDRFLYGVRMRAGRLLFVFVAACGSAPSSTSDDSAGDDAPPPPPPPGGTYDSDGPIQYTVTPQQIANGGSTINATLYMPSTPGKHPLVALSCGSTQTAAGYVTYGKRLASYGIAALIEDDAGALTNTGDITPNAAFAVDTWVPQMLGDQVDTAKIGLAGHSRGGAVSLLIAEHELAGKVVAWFGLDPVDNQFGQTPRQFARTDLGSIGIPTAFLGAEVTSNCAPAADSYPTLFPLAPAPSVLIVGLGAGHTQLEPADGCTACGICSPSGTADPAVVLAYATRYLTAFFARELLGDTAVGATFDGALGPDDVAAGRVTIMAK